MCKLKLSQSLQRITPGIGLKGAGWKVDEDVGRGGGGGGSGSRIDSD